MLGLEVPASIVAGFIPIRVDVPDIGAGGLQMLPVWITPLSATLVHGGFVHLVLNLVMLVYCGRKLESALGSAGVTLLYVVGAYAGAAGQWAQWSIAVTPMVGASGAISAWIAGYALLFAERPVPAIGPIPSRVVRIVWLAAAWIGIQLLIGLATLGGGTQIAIGAHVGGFLAGLVLTRPLLLWRYRNA